MRRSWMLLLVLGQVVFSCGPGEKHCDVNFQVEEDQHRVGVIMDGEIFTAYRFEEDLEKPVLYPVFAPGGEPVTRGYPIEPREKERVDHPHHSGLWFNYGDVNGFDFWNNSGSIPPGKRGKYGRIIHREIIGTRVEGHKGFLEVSMDWMAPDTGQVEKILGEHTTFVFQGYNGLRITDRITRLTAVHGDVIFSDSKEGMLAIRVARAFEHPSDKPILLTDATGIPLDEPVLDNEGVTGWYRNSNGEEGPDAWGKNARWVKLGGVIGGQACSIVIFDHPGNINYPSCWHARTYGLFSVNNLGRHGFNKALEPYRLILKKGETLEFRHRIVIATGDLSDEEIGLMEEDFISD